MECVSFLWVCSFSLVCGLLDLLEVGWLLLTCLKLGSFGLIAALLYTILLGFTLVDLFVL